MKKENKKYGVIYALRDPETLEIRYVGQTIRSLEKRLFGHIYSSKNSNNKTHKQNWLYKLVANNSIPLIEELETCVVEDLDVREVFWIKVLKEQGCNLTNLTSGGNAKKTFKHTEEAKKKISTGLKKSEKFQKAVRGLERTKKILATKKERGVKLTQEQREARSKKMKEWFKNHDGTFKGKTHTEETKQKLSKKRKEGKYFGEKNPFFGKTHSQENRDKWRKLYTKVIELYDLDKNLIKVFKNGRPEVGEYFGIKNVSSFSTIAKYQKIYRGKYLLKYENDPWL